LALALPFGANLTAFAQTPSAEAPPRPASPAQVAQPPADAVKKHDQELDAVRAQQRESADSQTKLRLQIETLSEDRRALNQQLIASAARVRDVEAKIDATRSRLQSLDQRERALQKSFDQRRAVIVEILAALQRVSRQPPPALLVQPEDALKALRTAITLGAVVPDMQAEASSIASGLTDLSRVRKDIVGERTGLAQNLDRLAKEQLRLNMLIEARQKKQADVRQALASEQQHSAELGRQADNLADLIAELESSLPRNDRAASGVDQALEKNATRPDLAALNDPGRLAPAVAFADTRGRLPLPVDGVTVRDFGTPNGFGGTQKGISIAAHQGAEITSPCDGWVVYAGPFRSYG
ncbi:MAG: murein hydrolase activator EnvC family protein, partial [Xanthobacteraceae bacterium]